MTLPAMIAGALIGGGLFLGLRVALVPPQQDLGRRLRRIYEPAPSVTGNGMTARWQRWAMETLELWSPDPVRQAQDLAVCAETDEQLALHKLGFAVAGAVTPLAFTVLWSSVGATVPVALVLLLCAAGGVLGFLIPDGVLRQAAQHRRREFRYALSLFLDLVVVVMAGGGGVESALRAGANAGTGWSFDLLRTAVWVAGRQNQSMWAALSELADRIGSTDLAEVSSSVQLAGQDGARVMESLRAKAISVRDRDLSEAEAEARTASQRMGAPVVLMFIGMMTLLGYPALMTMLQA